MMDSRDNNLVTIITLSYRKYDYIFDAIKSVLEQDYNNIQYIISDDGAPNFPREDIENFVNINKKRNIKEFLILSYDKNVGTVKNLNRAVSYAKGKYIVALSSDDVFYNNNVVGRIVNEFKKRKCNVLGTLRLRCNEDLKPIRYMPMKYYQHRIMKMDTALKQYEAFVTGYPPEMTSGSVLSYTREYLENNPFDETYILWEDGPFIERYLREGNFLELDYDIIAIYYREGGVSTSNEVNPIMEDDIKRYRYKTYSNVQNMPLKISSVMLLENYYMRYKENLGVLLNVKKMFNMLILLPIRAYYRLETTIVCYVEKWLMRNGFIK